MREIVGIVVIAYDKYVSTEAKLPGGTHWETHLYGARQLRSLKVNI